MVHKSAKGKVLGKENKLKLVDDQRKAIMARRSRDDKRWKRVLSKMSVEKKAKFSAMEKVSRRGVTRRFLRKNMNKERTSDTVAYECTIHLAKLLKGRTFHKRAPTAVKKIRAFAHKLMRTKDNRIEDGLNSFLWSRGVKGVPRRVRVKIERKVSEARDGQAGRKQLFSVVSYVDCKNFEGKTTKQIVKK